MPSTKSKKQDKSKFLEISCPKCRNRQVIFGKSVSLVKCLKCNYLLLKTSGGKSKIRAHIKNIIE